MADAKPYCWHLSADWAGCFGSRQQIREIRFCLTGPPLLTLAGYDVACLLHRLSPMSAAIVYTLSGIPPGIYLFCNCRSAFRHTFKEAITAVGTLLSYGLRSFGIDLCGTLGTTWTKLCGEHALAREDGWVCRGLKRLTCHECSAAGTWRLSCFPAWWAYPGAEIASW